MAISDLEEQATNPTPKNETASPKPTTQKVVPSGTTDTKKNMCTRNVKIGATLAIVFAVIVVIIVVVVGVAAGSKSSEESVVSASTPPPVVRPPGTVAPSKETNDKLNNFEAASQPPKVVPDSA